MKKAALAIFLTSLLGTPAVFARQGGNRPDPAAFVARRVQHLTTLLDLTPSQVTAATTAFTAAATANATLETQLRAAHQTLKADIEGGSGNVASDAATIGNLEGQIVANNAVAEKTFRGSLTSVQQDKLKALGPQGSGGRFAAGPGGR